MVTTLVETTSMNASQPTPRATLPHLHCGGRVNSLSLMATWEATTLRVLLGVRTPSDSFDGSTNLSGAWSRSCC